MNSKSVILIFTFWFCFWSIYRTRDSLRAAVRCVRRREPPASGFGQTFRSCESPVAIRSNLTRITMAAATVRHRDVVAVRGLVGWRGRWEMALVGDFASSPVDLFAVGEDYTDLKVQRAQNIVP